MSYPFSFSGIVALFLFLIQGPPPNSESHHPPRLLHSRPIQPPFIAIDVHAPPLAPPPSEPPLSNAVIDDGAIVSSPVDSISVSHASAFTHGGIPSTNGHASMSGVGGGSGGGGRARGTTLSRAVQRTMHALLELIESEQSYVADLKLLARYAQSFTSDRALSLALLASNSAQGSNQQQKEQPIMNRLNISQLLDTHNPLARALQDLHPSVQGAIQSGTGESSSPNERDVVELLACAAGVFRDFVRISKLFPLKPIPDNCITSLRLGASFVSRSLFPRMQKCIL
ncbi:hypothetical protein DL93DRAFT_1297003 [Clavulina sp. PMI_390]|nr:hypothetical protein DL93DRAFT_1297003 [Clavulina sp. PMI_390]